MWRRTERCRSPRRDERTGVDSIVGDTLDEPDELLSVTFDTPTNATIADGAATVTIVDNDSAPSLAVADASVTEGTLLTATLTFAVTLSGPSTQPVTVNYATTNGTATAPGDYAAASGTLTFTPGTTTRSINVSVARDSVTKQMRQSCSI